MRDRERGMPLHDRRGARISVLEGRHRPNLASGFSRGANAPVQLRSGGPVEPARDRRFACGLPDGHPFRVPRGESHTSMVTTAHQPDSNSRRVVNRQPDFTRSNAASPRRTTYLYENPRTCSAMQNRLHAFPGCHLQVPKRMVGVPESMNTRRSPDKCPRVDAAAATSADRESPHPEPRRGVAIPVARSGSEDPKAKRERKTSGPDHHGPGPDALIPIFRIVPLQLPPCAPMRPAGGSWGTK